MIRHLPSPASSGARLLDVGCGNGSFLEQMRLLGWAVVGLEPDASAASVARSRGLEVHQGVLDEPFAATQEFDAITLGHVVEHLHDPARTLRLCFEALRPGGRLWIGTPNLDAMGHDRFGPDWRGLEPPRHLVLFTPDSLSGLLDQIGFERITQPSPDDVTEWFYLASAAIEHRIAPDDCDQLPSSALRALRSEALKASQRCRKAPGRAEELELLALKPLRHAKGG